MRNHIAAALALSDTAVFACSTASATNFNYFDDVARGASLRGAIIKVHSRRKVHDMLHGYGYDRVVYRSRYYDEYDKPVPMQHVGVLSCLHISIVVAVATLLKRCNLNAE